MISNFISTELKSITSSVTRRSILLYLSLRSKQRKYKCNDGAVEALDGYRLHVRFIDGLEGEVDMSERVRSPRAGVFVALADPDVFAQVHVEFGAVTWPGELDLAPDAMHDEIEKNRVWRLR